MTQQGQAFGMVAAVFVVGAVSGAIGMHLFDEKMDTPPVLTMEYEEDSHAALDQMSRELGLNQEQTARVQAILDECIMEEADLLMRVKKVQQQGRDRILEVLDEEQRAAFDAMFLETSAR